MDGYLADLGDVLARGTKASEPATVAEGLIEDLGALLAPQAALLDLALGPPS